jgi:hypothetical protein
MATDLRAFNLAFAALLRNQTSAQGRVSPVFTSGGPERFPQISFGIVGEITWAGYTAGRDQRVALRCHGRNPGEVGIEQARKLYSECRDILLPAANVVYGYYGQQTVTLDGVPVTVTFSGIQHNAGPNEMMDIPTGTPYLESFWLCPHY